MFREEEHPRDKDGKFTEKGKGESSVNNENAKIDLTGNITTQPINDMGKVEKSYEEEVNSLSKPITEQDLQKGYEMLHKGMGNDYKPFERKAIDIKEVKSRGGLTDEEAQQTIKLAETLSNRANQKDPRITRDIVNTAKKLGTTMYGLEYRQKQPTSMAGKIGEDSKKSKLSFEESADDMKDTLRYTMISNEDNFVDNFNKSVQELENKGYTMVRCKNYFDLYNKGESNQKAVQCVFMDKDGFMFELQFHTENSQAVKDGYNHKRYELSRKKTTKKEDSKRLDDLMKQAGKRVIDPKNIDSIKTFDNTKKREDNERAESSQMFGVNIKGGK